MTTIQKYRLSIVGIAIITVYLGATEVADRWQASWEVYRSLSAKEAKLANPENAVEQRRELQAEVVALRSTTTTSLGEIERSENGVIALIGRYAKKTGVRITSLTPRKGESASTSDIQMSVTGRYHDIGRMVNLLEQAPLVIRIQKLEMSKLSASLVSGKIDIRASIAAKRDGM